MDIGEFRQHLLATPEASFAQNFAHWLSNASENEQRGHFGKGASIDELFNRFHGDVVLAAPGPSLEEALPYIKASGKPIMACNSSLNPLVAAGISPLITLCIHSEKLQGEQIAEVANKIDEDAILVCPVTIHPSVPENWPGQIAWFVMHDPAPLYQVVELACKDHAKGFDFGRLVAGGSVIVSMLESAARFAFDRVFIVGAEFGAEPAGRYYAARAALNKDVQPIVDIGRSQDATPMAHYRRFRQATGYRLAAQQRIEFFRGHRRFEVRSMSPFSMLPAEYIHPRSIAPGGEYAD